MIEKLWEMLHEYGIYTMEDLNRELSPIDITVFCGGNNEHTEN